MRIDLHAFPCQRGKESVQIIDPVIDHEGE